MIRTTRRQTVAGAVAMPLLAGTPGPAWARGTGAVMLFDAGIEAARRIAEASEAQGDEVLAIAGDRIRFARQVLERRPRRIVGVTLAADALLIEDVAREAGYLPDPAGSAAVGRMLGAEPALGWVLAPRA